MQCYRLVYRYSLRYGHVWEVEPLNKYAMDYLIHNCSPWNTPVIR